MVLIAKSFCEIWVKFLLGVCWNSSQNLSSGNIVDLSFILFTVRFLKDKLSYFQSISSSTIYFHWLLYITTQKVFVQTLNVISVTVETPQSTDVQRALISCVTSAAKLIDEVVTLDHTA